MLLLRQSYVKFKKPSSLTVNIPIPTRKTKSIKEKISKTKTKPPVKYTTEAEQLVEISKN